jgi:predicted nucleic acid-binding Zn ribbon protein
MTDEPLTVCPECGNHIRRILFPAGVVFKGQGFYKTDHAKASSLPPGEIKSAENGNGASKPTETKTGESPAAASTPKSESASSTSSGS